MASREDAYIGKQIGGAYRLIAKINSGAFGSVYQAQHLIFDDDPVVAIKLLRGLVITEQERQSFFQEARLLRKLRHPHVLPILDAGIQEETPYIVMEYASGGSLKDRLQQRPGQPLPENEALSILKQIGEALHYAHTQPQPIVHRDLKPDNILFNAKGEVLLADFGIAAILSSGTKDLGRGGTPAYMAPEQFQGMVSTKSDQYALACIAYELLTGRPPFDLEGASMEVVWYHHTKVPPTTPKQYNSRLSDNIAQAILTALAKDRTTRHVDIPTFIAALSIQKSAKTAQQWFDEGSAFYNQKKYEDALKAYEEAIRLNPQHANAYFRKGDTLDELGRSEEAVRMYDEAIRLNPNDANIYYYKGIALQNLKRFDDAVRAYDEAIRLNPSYATAYLNKGNALSDLKKYEEAVRAYEQAIRLNPNYALAYNNKGIALSDLKRFDDAVRAYDEAIRLNPSYATAYYNKGNALRDLKRFDDAVRAYDEAIRLNPSDADAYNNKGIALEDLKKYTDALRAYEEAIRLNPNYGYAYNNKGDMLKALGRHTEAQQAYQKARELGYKG